MSHRIALALAFSLLGIGATPTRGQTTAADSAIERQTRALASDLRCPVCQGLSIQDSPSALALDMRAVIKDQLKSGRTPDEVRQYFVDKYGEWILLAPEPSGFNVLVYLIPILAVAVGLAIVWRSVRRWTGIQGRGPGAEGRGTTAEG